VQGPRDELELSLREALDPFFDIRSITFSRADVTARKTDRPGWQETVLAYIHLRVKDASVDRVPPVEMELSFLDLSGPVTLPAQSAETLISVSAGPVAPRPVEKIRIVQTLDPRSFVASGGLTLHLIASAVGLVPELDDLLDMEPVKAVAEVRSAAPHGGALVKELHSWGERVSAISEREWTVVLDAASARGAGQPVLFTYPIARRADVSISSQTYDDINLVAVPGPSVEIGGGALVDAPVVPPPRCPPARIAGAAAALAALLLLAFLIRRRARHRAASTERPRDVFKMPAQVDGFVVVRLLRKLASSPRVGFGADDRAAVQLDIDRVQQAVFAPGAAGLSDLELREIAGKWLARLH
jgi:hypothetical protein